MKRAALIMVLMIVFTSFKAQSVEEKGRLKNGTISLENGLISMDLRDEDLSSVIILIVSIYEPPANPGGQYRKPEKPFLHCVFHPEVNHTVTIKLSGVTKIEAINRVFRLSPVGVIYTGEKTVDYPTGNIAVVVPYEKMSDSRYQSKFIDIRAKHYHEKPVFMSLERADTEDIMHVLEDLKVIDMGLQESCRNRITLHVDNLAAALVADVICVLLEYDVIEQANGRRLVRCPLPR